MGPVPDFVHTITGFNLENQSSSVDFYDTSDRCDGEARRGRGKVSDIDEGAYAGLAFLHIGSEGCHRCLFHKQDQVRS